MSKLNLTITKTMFSTYIYLRTLSNSALSLWACTAKKCSFCAIWSALASINIASITAFLCASSASFLRHSLSVFSCARLALRASLSASSSRALSCNARNLAVSFSFSNLILSCSFSYAASLSWKKSENVIVIISCSSSSYIPYYKLKLINIMSDI